MRQGYRKDRRFPRIPAEHAVLVRLLGGPRFEGFAKTRVIGLGGCMFVNPESLGYGSLMELLISVQGKVIRTDARVAYEITRGREHQVGVEFLRLHPTDRALLSSLIARTQAEERAASVRDRAG
jgi:PilZ domain-containing protein